MIFFGRFGVVPEHAFVDKKAPRLGLIVLGMLRGGTNMLSDTGCFRRAWVTR